MSIPLHLDSDPEQASSPQPTSTGDEQAAAFLDWAESFPDASVLSDEAISRTNLYPDRW